jgi:exonuclease III
VSYNVLNNSILDYEAQPAFQRMLTALDPDILCLQESGTKEEVQAVVTTWLDGDWYVDGSGTRVILSRFPIDTDWPSSMGVLSDRFILNRVQTPSGPLIVFNGHLSAGNEDALRQEQADSFIAFLREAAATGGAMTLGTPFVLVGDLNMGGLSGQLHTLQTGDIADELTYGADYAPDWDGSGLLDLVPRHQEWGMAYTWRNDNKNLWPTRFDFALVADSTLAVEKRFILYTDTLTDATLSAHGLLRGDRVTASDHAPVVVDLLLGD